jgi:MoxR-like ATPase
MSNTNWHIFKKDGEQNSDWSLPDPPSWRAPNQENGSGGRRDRHRGETFQPSDTVVEMVNAALYLRRPLLITGKPGTGKSSVAYAVARQLVLGEVLYWPITTRTTLKSGLYDYDAIGRLQDAKQLSEKSDNTSDNSTNELANIGSYITLGPLGTALIPSKKPRVLLIDEIDKSDIDLPNDLLTILEEGGFEIPELVRIKEKVSKVSVRTAYTDPKQIASTADSEQSEQDEKTAPKKIASKADLEQSEKYEITDGRITCHEFPFVVLTSNGERAFPPAFLRRCLRLQMPVPNGDELTKIVEAHLGEDLKKRKNDIAKQDKEAAEIWYNQALEKRKKLIDSFLEKTKKGDIATDQLLNAIFMVTREKGLDSEDKLIDAFLMKPLTSNEDT